MNRSREFRDGLRDGYPIMLGYLAVSFTFGIMAVGSGLTVWEAALISLTNVTSAGQFAGITVIAAGGAYIEMILTQLVINLRYCLMSFSLSQKMDPAEPRRYRFAVAFGITDEIFGISATRPGFVSAFYNFGAMCAAIPGWVLGTFLGALSGSILPHFIISALSVALYGMFIAIVMPPAKADRAVRLAVLAAMVLSTAFAFLPGLKNVSSGFAIIIVTVLVSAAAAALAPVKDSGEEAQAHGA